MKFIFFHWSNETDRGDDGNIFSHFIKHVLTIFIIIVEIIVRKCNSPTTKKTVQ